VFVGGVRLGFGVLFLSCVCVSVSGVLFSVGLCVCDRFLLLHRPCTLFYVGARRHAKQRHARLARYKRRAGAEQQYRGGHVHHRQEDGGRG